MSDITSAQPSSPARREIRLADYRPFPYAAPSVDLRFELDPEETRVHAKVRYVRDATATTRDLVLPGWKLRLLDVRLDGAPLPPDRYEATPDRLVIRDAPAAFELETVVAICPAANTAKKGLFFHTGRLITHCEPEGFRALTYFPDRPDVLSTYTVTVSANADAFPVLLSNGDLIAEGQDGVLRWRRFHDPYPKPTYIFALMAGPFERREAAHVTPSGRHVTLELYADVDDIGRTAFALEALKAALMWDEAVFGLEYDLDTYRLVSLPAYAGAQENKGLNLFGSDLIVADPEITTDEEYELIRRIVGHEAFHNWTGNRVTCRDWFQLSLKEGLTRLRDQLFTEDAIDAGVYRIDQVRALRRNQFPEDDGPAAHPVQPQSFVKIDNFYTNTVYEKGAEVLRMLRTLLGPEGFIAAVRAYLSRHDGQAVTMESLVVAAEAIGGRDLTQFRRWFVQPGRPRLTAETGYDPATHTFTLRLEQAPPPATPDAAPLHVPVTVALLARDGRRLGAERVCELTERAATFTFEQVPEPPTPSVLRRFSAPVSLSPFLSEEDLANLVRHDDDPFVAWDSLQSLLVTEIRRLAKAWRAQQTMELSPALLELFGHALHQARPARLTALMLSVPDEPVLSEGLAQIDLDASMAARAFVRREISRAHRNTLVDVYAAQTGIRPADLSAAAVGGRMLRNAALDLMLADDGEWAANLAFAQVRDGPSMTESFEALSLLAHQSGPQRAAARNLFYARHSGRPLALDKWFKALALSRAPGAVDEIIALAGHPDLDLGNTSRILAFFGSFFRQNRVTFHDPSGKGYDFLADRLIAADRLGAGRPGFLMAQIDQWRRYDETRQGKMRAALESILAAPNTSVSLQEVVRRSLGV